MKKSNPKRVGATIERESIKRLIARMRKRYEADPEYTGLAVINSIERYLMGRFKRISKKKGGL